MKSSKVMANCYRFRALILYGVINMIVTKPTAFDNMLADAIGKLIDLDPIVDRLLATDCQQCSMFTHEQVKFAFLKWIEHNLDSIEMQPEWFIHQEPKHFYRHLPFDDLQEATDLREYDYAEIYCELDDNDDKEYTAEMDKSARINSREIAKHIARQSKMRSQFDNESLLEDDFEGTPEEAAKSAINW
ncbi:hypothetical protein [Microcoleus sp. D3_18a_C4]|uniref:hypothetical protein n=1 Tax=Microcoleus sp. D3_18a_C4 TaxID=3055332 RepID=UPI002FCEA4BF